jgi:hypothetical protein
MRPSKKSVKGLHELELEHVEKGKELAGAKIGGGRIKVFFIELANGQLTAEGHVE